MKRRVVSVSSRRNGFLTILALTCSLAAACGRDNRETESSQDPSQSRSALVSPDSLTFDFDGYPGKLCFGTFTCIRRGAGPLNLPDAVYSVTATSTNSVGGDASSSEIGKLTVKRGAATPVKLESVRPHFTPTDTGWKLITTPVTFQPNGTPVSVYLSQHHTFNGPEVVWDANSVGNVGLVARLLMDRQYIIGTTASLDLIQGSGNREYGRLYVHLDGSVTVTGTVTEGQFTTTPGSGTFSAIVTHLRVPPVPSRKICASSNSTWGCGQIGAGLDVLVIPGRQYYVTGFDKFVPVDPAGACSYPQTVINGVSVGVTCGDVSNRCPAGAASGVPCAGDFCAGSSCSVDLTNNPDGVATRVCAPREPLPLGTACTPLDKCQGATGRCAISSYPVMGRVACVSNTPPPACDDANACTKDWCDSFVGCQHDEPLATCPASGFTNVQFDLDGYQQTICFGAAGCISRLTGTTLNVPDGTYGITTPGAAVRPGGSASAGTLIVKKSTSQVDPNSTPQVDLNSTFFTRTGPAAFKALTAPIMYQPNGATFPLQIYGGHTFAGPDINPEIVPERDIGPATKLLRDRSYTLISYNGSVDPVTLSVWTAIGKLEVDTAGFVSVTGQNNQFLTQPGSSVFAANVLQVELKTVPTSPPTPPYTGAICLVDPPWYCGPKGGAFYQFLIPGRRYPIPYPGGYLDITSAGICTFGPSTAAIPLQPTCTPVAPLAPPTALQATIVSSSRVDVNWTASTSAVTGYVVERADGIGGFAPVPGCDGPANLALSCSDTRPLPAVNLQYRVYGYNGALKGYSTEAKLALGPGTQQPCPVFGMQCADDADKCNGVEMCQPDLMGSLRCLPNPASVVNCNDNNSCTLDACAPSSGCTHAQDPAVNPATCGPTCDGSCDDNQPCTVDSCSPTLGCVHSSAAAEGASCGSTSTCDVNICEAGACVTRRRIDAPGSCGPASGPTACTVDVCTGLDCASTAALPEGAVVASEAGSLPPLRGTIDVDLTGQAVYRMPLWVPDGGSLTPELTLQYRTAPNDVTATGRYRDRESEAGLWWDFPELYSEIAFCSFSDYPPATGRPFYTTLVEGRSTSAGDQELCLDGKPLTLVTGTDLTVGAEYRTQPSNFARIKITGVDGEEVTSFKVETKDGLIHQYSSAVVGLLPLRMAQIETGPPKKWQRFLDGTTPAGTLRDLNYRWLRTSTADRYGNFITYKYLPPDPAVEGEIDQRRMVLDTIKYGHVGSVATRTIRFNYVPIVRTVVSTPGPNVNDGTGALLHHKLDHINITTTSGETWARTYNFEYATSPTTSRILLQKIQQCDGLSATASRQCSNHTVFDYRGLGTTVPSDDPELDHLLQITDGMGANTYINYAAAIDDDVYQRVGRCANFTSPDYKYCWLVGDRDILTYSYSVDGPAGPSYVRLKYTNGRETDKQGFIGFEQVERNYLTEGKKVTEYFQPLAEAADDPNEPAATRWPLLITGGSLPVRRVTEITSPAPFQFVRTTDESLHYRLIHTGITYFTRFGNPWVDDVITVTEKRGTAEPVVLSQTTVKTTYDDSVPSDYGNGPTIVETTTTSNGRMRQTSVTKEYENRPTDWLIGLETKKTETSTSDAGVAGNVAKALYEFDTMTTATTYDAKGQVETVVNQPDQPTSDEYLSTRFYRTSTGRIRLVDRTDSNGVHRRVATTYDSNGIYVATTALQVGVDESPNDLKTTFVTHPDIGVILSSTDPSGVTTTFSYDRMGRPRRTNFPGGGGLSQSYAMEPVTGVTGAYQARLITTSDSGSQTTTRANRTGQIIESRTREVDGETVTRNTYDILGYPKLTSLPGLGSAGPDTTNTYDVLGRPRIVQRPEDGKTPASTPGQADGTLSDGLAKVETEYDALNATVTDSAMGRTRKYSYDDAGNLLESTLVNGGGQNVKTNWTYGAFGRLRYVTRNNAASTAQQETEIKFDHLSRRISVKDPDAGLRTIDYNGFGDVRKQTDANGTTTSFIYDAFGRVERREVTAQPATVYTWDLAPHGKGRLFRTTSSSGVVDTMSYDSFGRVERIDRSVAGVSSIEEHRYDSVGRLSRISYPAVDGHPRLVVKNSYSALSGQLMKVENDCPSAALPANTYWTLQATAAGGVPAIELFGNGASTTYTYSPTTNRLSGITTTSSAAAARDLSYSYWANGELRAKSTLASLTAPTARYERFENDPIGQIGRWVQATSTGEASSTGWEVKYNVNDFGSLTSRTATGGGQTQSLSYAEVSGTNRITTSPFQSGSFGYDLNGNQKTRPDGTKIDYTSFDLPDQIWFPGATTPSETFRYDAAGARAEKRRSDSDFTLYTGLSEYRKNGTSAGRIQYIFGGSGLVAQVTQNTGQPVETTYVHPDILRTIDSVSDQSGVFRAMPGRDPYGNKLASLTYPELDAPIVGGPTTAESVRHGFTGHEEDADLGLINMQGRIFDPALGRFLTPDPFSGDHGTAGDYNRYSYVMNRPADLSDPSGYQSQPPWVVGDHITQRADETPVAPITRDQAKAIQRFFEFASLGAIQNDVLRLRPVSKPIAMYHPPDKPPGKGARPSEAIAQGPGGVWDGNSPPPPGSSAWDNFVWGMATASMPDRAGTPQNALQWAGNETLKALWSFALGYRQAGAGIGGDADGGETLFRGVHDEHPGFSDALAGEAYPRGGHDDPAAHNLGDTRSVFTSWTTCRETACSAAADARGIVLEKRFPRSEWVSSPDRFQENEVLIRGPVKGAKVTKP
jgi:RHS repeat-associated protein